MSAAVQGLLLLYAGALLINTLISAALWNERRDPLLRAQFFVWASTMVGFITQAVGTQNNLAITIGYSPVFIVSLSITHLVAMILGLTVRWRPFWAIMGVGIALSVAAFFSGASFFVTALPVAIGASLPTLYIAVVAIASRWRELTFSRKGLIITVLVYGLHMLDFAILRDKPEAMAIAFTIGNLIIFTLSIFVPAVVLEAVTRQQARIAAEVNVARRIQTDLLPRKPSIPGMQLACYMKPAEEIGGDYYDICTVGQRAWVLLGDVTGHGLSSGLVMLIAQSVIRAILHAQPDIGPAALNVLANRVLYDNLQRLHEERQMTIVSICVTGKNQFSFSGCHDNIYIYRSATREVEAINVSQMPCGLGFVEAMEEFGVGEDTFQLLDNDLLLMVTDGVTEAASGGDYGKGVFEEKRLIEFMKSRGHEPIEQIKTELTAKLHEFTGGIFHDDVTFLLARMDPS